jgi:hypothetical protein
VLTRPALPDKAEDEDLLIVVSDVVRFPRPKVQGAFSSAMTRGPNCPLVRLPENSSSPTSVSAHAETYFLQTTSCQNSRRSEGFLSEVVQLCFTRASLRSGDAIPTDVTPVMQASKAYAVSVIDEAWPNDIRDLNEVF